MAKRRLNTRFLVIAGILLALPVAGAIAYKTIPQVKWMVRGTPTKHAAEAKLLFEQGRYKEAGDKYYRAIYLGAKTPELYTALGDCFARMVLDDRENLVRVVRSWNDALSIDPLFLPALQRLLDLYRDDADMNRGSGTVSQRWDTVYDTAGKILAVDPDNLQAKVSQHTAVIQKWIAQVEIDQARVDAAIDSMLALSQQEPFDPDTITFVIRATIYRAQEASRLNDMNAARGFFAEAAKLCEDALAAHPNDAVLNYRMARVYMLMGSMERTGNQPPKYRDRVEALAARAAALAKPEDEEFAAIKMLYGRALELNGQQAEAVKVYREVFEQCPHELGARLVLAESLGRDAAHRGEAIELLRTIPPPDPNKYVAMKAIVYRELELQALANKINLLLDTIPSVADPAQQDKLLQEIDAGYAKLSTEAGENPNVLLIRGRIELAKGQNVPAVQTLDRALQRMPQTDFDLRYKVMLWLAQACVKTGQTGRAKELLTVVVRDIERYAPARLMLAEILLRENDIDEARKHLDYLSRTMPDSPVVLILQIRTLDKEKDKARIDELYAKLPEASKQLKVEKAQMALYIGRRDEAVRLIQELHEVSPDDPLLVGALARLYRDLGEDDKSQALLAEGLKRNPGHPGLQLLQAQLGGASEEQMGQLTRELVEKITDPFRKEMALFQLALREENEEEAMKHLEAAAQIKPDDGRVVDLLFKAELARQNWDKASQYLEKLSKANEDQAGGMLYRVQFAMARGQLDEAADFAQQLVQKMPEFGQSWVMLGGVMQAQGKYAEAIQHYSAATQKQPQNVEAVRGLIECAYAMGNDKEAARYIEQARQLFPRDEMFKELELSHELTYGDPQKVIAPRQEMLQKNPDSIRAWVSMGNTYMAVAQGKSTEPSAAKQYLEKARETASRAAAKWPDEARFTSLIAEASLLLRDVPTGEKALLALRERPGWKGQPDPTIVLAEYYRRAGRPADAEKTLREFLAAYPQQVRVQTQLAALLENQGRLEEGLQVLLSSNADDPMVRRRRIDMQITAGRLADAEKEIQAALATTANPSPTLLNMQAYVYWNSGRASEAMKILDGVLAANPRDAMALHQRSVIRMTQRRDIDAAIRDLTTVRDLAPDKIDARLALADAYRLKGDNDGAIRELESALRQDSGNKQVRLRLIELYGQSVPPRWNQVERAIREGRNLPQFADDVNLIHAEAQMWLARKDVAKARQLIEEALKKYPNDQDVFRTWCVVMLQDKQYRQLLQATDGMVRSKKAPWWVYQFRGRSKKALDDRAAALDEFSAGLDAATEAKDDAAAMTLAQTIAAEIGARQAINRVIPRAEAGDNRWRLMVAYLLQIDGDYAGAITWIERITQDPQASAAELVQALRVQGTLCLQIDPPEPAKAVEIYRKLLERSPNDPAVLNNLAYTMTLPNSGCTAQDALQYSQKAYDLMAQAGVVDPYIADTHGYMLVLVGRLDEGISLLQQAVDQKGIPEVYYHLAEAYMLKDKALAPEAEKALKQAQALQEQADREHFTVDSQLKSKIEEALQRAQQMQLPAP